MCIYTLTDTPTRSACMIHNVNHYKILGVYTHFHTLHLIFFPPSNLLHLTDEEAGAQTS